MEYIYAAMLLHTAGQEVNEKVLKKVLKAAGSDADEARVSLNAALEDVTLKKLPEKPL